MQRYVAAYLCMLFTERSKQFITFVTLIFLVFLKIMAIIQLV